MAKKTKIKPVKYKRYSPPKGKAKVLIFDIETAPILAHVWGLWENNVALNQMISDWHVLSWSAKWLWAPESEIMYMDQRAAKNIEDDYDMLKEIWSLLDEADVVVTQNGKSFDQKKLQARFVINKLTPTSSFKHEDTKLIAQRHFAFPSFKLEYMSDILCTKYKKLKHKKFPGHELWRECLNGNLEAWQEMEKYNKHDVLTLEELYKVLKPWDTRVNFNLYHEEEKHECACGSTEHIKNGFYYTNMGKFQRYRCKNPKCGAETRGRINLFSKEKKDSIQQGTVR